MLLSAATEESGVTANDLGAAPWDLGTAFANFPLPKLALLCKFPPAKEPKVKVAQRAALSRTKMHGNLG